MTDGQKYIKTLAIATLGLGCAYILTKYTTNLKSVLRRLTNRNSLKFKSIKVINTEAECKFVVELLMRFGEKFLVYYFSISYYKLFFQAML